MTRANFVKAAAKDYPEHGIKKGDSYYWWKFRHGGKRFSKTPPRDSQLTQSAYHNPVNSDGQTEDEYWQAKLEEVQSNWSFDIS